MDNIEDIKKRIEKAESLPKEIREQFLFDYLKLKTLSENKENDYWDFLLKNIVFAEENGLITANNLIKFVEQFEEDYKTSKQINLELLLRFTMYTLSQTPKIN